MRDWPSYGYWTASSDRTKQYWYVSFCLMFSAVQDRLTGLALKETNNLNWATTAFYYGAVHAGRLLCFLCCGDYPTSHADLACLLRREGYESKSLNFNWLAEFSSGIRAHKVRADSPRGGEPGRDGDDRQPIRAHKVRAGPLRQVLWTAVQSHLPESAARFRNVGELLNPFKTLRNDCNYEALLVAHEKDHDLVTKGFDDLVAAAARVSETAADAAIAAYRENLNNAVCFAAERGRFHAAHKQYVGRLKDGLEYKFGGSRCAQTALASTVGALAIDTPDSLASDVDVSDFLAPIMHDIFQTKLSLMQRWQADVSKLSEAVRSPTEPACPRRSAGLCD